MNPKALVFIHVATVCALPYFIVNKSVAQEHTPATYESALLEAEKTAVKLDLASAPGYLTLAECLALAMKQNFKILEAEEQIKKQSGIELQAEAILYPKLRSSGEYKKVDAGRLAVFDGRTFGADEGWNGTVQLEQPLFLGGEGLAARREQYFRSEAAQLALEGVINDVVLDVRTRVYDVLLARARIAVREGAVGLLEEELQSTKNRLEAGTVSQFNVLRAEVELANARTPLIQARNDFRISLEELARVLAVQPADASAVAPSIQLQGTLQFSEPQLDLPAALSKAREQRPEVKRLKLLLEAEEQGIKLAHSNFFPEVYAFAGYGGESSRFNNDLSDVDHGWELGVRVQWDIFDGGRSIGKRREASSAKQLVKIALEQELLNIDIEVRRAMSRLVEARELVLASRKVVAQAEESLRLARARLEAGSGRQLDVLDTRVSLTQAQTNEIESLHSFNIASATLDRAVSKGSKGSGPLGGFSGRSGPSM